jgi:hypothetical protein
LQPEEAATNRLKSQIARLEREIQCHEKASNDWECAPGFVVDTIRKGVDIEHTGEDSPPTANLHHYIAKHPETNWESDHYIDKGHAIRRTWEYHLEMSLAEITKERDELKRRWAQRKKTEESKKKGEQGKEDTK